MNKFLVCIYVILIFYNMSISYSQEITPAQKDSIPYQKTIQYELPKQYLIDNKSTLYPKENPFRRADIVFFLSIPVTFFIVQNILNLFNTLNIQLYNYNPDLGRDNFGYTSGEWNFILASLTLMPLSVMVYDQLYVKHYPLTLPFSQKRIAEIRMNFTVFRTRF